MSTFTIRVTSSATNTAGTNFGQQPDLGAPSFLDMIVSGSSDPMLPNGTYDAYCLNPLLDILLSPTTHTADGASSTTLASYGPIGFSSLTSQQVDQVNWLLSQNFTADPKYGGQFNYGEVQTAIWRLMGFTEAEIANAGLTRFLNDNNRNVVSAADIDFLIQSAQNAVASGNGVVPTDTYFAAVINPAGDVQPLIVQLQSAKLGNYVWADADADGIQDGGETGINNVIVELYDANGALIASTVTGDDFSTAAVEQGYYQFTGLKAGDYQVKFIAPAGQFISQQDANGNTLDATDSDADVTTGFSQLINLSVGESDQTIDAGLYQKASLGDYVWIDTNNDGQQNDGNTGLNGVTVNLKDVNGNTIATTVTANNGSNPGYYLFDNLTPGDYRVEFVKPAGYEFAQQDQGVDGSDSDADVTTGLTISTTLVSGENDLSWDAGLVPVQVPRASLGDRLWVDTNADGQQNDGATGIVGATVTLIGGGADGVIGTGGDDTSATTVTGVDGIYNFSGLNVGEEYQVQFAAPSGMVFTGQNVGNDTSDSDVDAMTGKTQIVTLASGEHNPTLDAGVYATASLGDYVWIDGNNDGQQNDGAAQGLNGVTVNLYSGATLVATRVTANDVNGNPGYYLFDNLTPGDYSVEFVKPAGYDFTQADQGADSNDSDANTTTGKTIITTLVSGENDLNWDAGLVLQVIPASLGDYVWVDTNNDGEQNDGAAQGLNGVTVNLYSGATLVATRVTGNDGMGNPGYYLFDNLTPGDYSVEFVKPTGYAFAKQDQGADGSDSDVNAAGQTIVTTLVSGENDLTWDAGVVKLASLGDRVWEDTNANGVQDSGETSIGNVTVELYDCVTNLLLKTTTTDGNGNYSFTDLTPGTYHVKFVAPNGYVYSAQDVTAEANGTDSDANSAGVTACYTVNSGDAITTVDAGLYQTASLGDYVWVDTNNDGEQNDGAAQGLNGVTVNLYSGATLVATRVTANDVNGNPGYYLFDNLTPGDYSVEFVKPAGYDFTQADQGADSNDSDANTTTGKTIITTLVSGENDLNWDAGLVLQVIPASLGDYVWVDTNNDGLQNDGAAQGLNGVTVNLYSGNVLVDTRVTANDGMGNPGYYLFDNLTPGDYSVEFVKPTGYAFAKQDQGADGSDSDVNAAGQTIVTTLVSGENDLSWDAGVVKLASLGDRVWEDTNANGVQDNGETGIGNVTVELYDCVTNLLLKTTTTDGNGNYSFTDLTPGTYHVKFVAPNGYVYSAQDVTAEANGTDSDANSAGITQCYTVNSGDNITTVDAGLYQQASIGDKVWLDSNANGVQDNGENGIAGVTVNLLNASGSVIGTTTTNAAGNYLFGALQPGDYAVQIVAPSGYSVSPKDAGGNDAADSDIDPVTGKTIVTTLVSGENDMSWDGGLHQKASIGDKVWLDCDADGIQDVNEIGISGVTVKLLSSTGTVLQTTTTDYQGNYLFNNLTPGDYAIQVVAPSGYNFTAKDQGADDSKDSDADAATGKTIVTTLVSGENDLSWDAGLTTVGACLDLDLTGGTSNGSSAGNIRTYTMNGLSVHASAFSRDDATGAWAKAYLASYSGGLGVTDTSEDGTTPNHAIDNTGGRDNYVLFEFDKTVLLDKAYLGWVSGDSDVQVWIGNLNSPFTTHVNLSDAVLTSMGFTEVNTTTLTTARWADLNAGDYAGNTIIIAADATDTSPEDFFKLQTLSICTPSCGLTASIGDKVWCDTDGDGVQDAGEVGVAGVTVKLLNAAGTVLSTTTTDVSGNYLFSNLAPGDYAIQVVAPTGYAFTSKDLGGNDASDSDVDTSTGKTIVTSLSGGENDMSWDAGLKLIPTKASIGNKVWHDLDYDGIQDANESGIANVTVKLLNSAGTVIATTTTNSVGEYLFSNLTPGDYKVQVIKPSGYYTTKQDQGSNNDVDSDVNSSGITALTNLVAGENDMSWDAGLYKKASIGDKVWEDKDHDDIQDSTEPGIANVKVMLQNSSGTTIATTYTNSTGNYKFSNLDPGTYRLVFDKTNTTYNGISMKNWMWASKDIGSNDSIDSDVNGDGVSKHNVAYTDYTTLTSGENDMTWDAAITPIVIDLNGDGIKTISRANSDGTFDLFGNGGAVNSGWLSGEDGFLAVDANGNGRIDDISEMFGGLAKGDGFAKLASYDSNGDGVVDANDADFASLKIWQDANGNHQTDAGELVSLTEAGVASLTVSYTELPFVDAQGNLHLERSNATLSDGSSVDMTDVYFNVSAEDAAAANVELASLGQLVGDDSGLDGLLAGLGGGVGMGMSSCANAEMFDTAGLDNLSRMAALYEEQAACCA